MNKVLSPEQYWDKAAGEKEFTTPFKIEVFREFVPEHSRILDIGCGYGRTLNELSLSGFNRLEGIDISEKMIERGKQLYPHLDLKKVDEGTLPFKDNSLDAVILVAVLTCVISDSGQELLLDDVYRVLRNGGILYINDFLINTDKRNLDRYRAGLSKYHNYGIFELNEKECVVLRHHSEEWIERLTAKFNTIVYKPVVYTTMNNNKSNGFYYMGRK